MISTADNPCPLTWIACRAGMVHGGGAHVDLEACQVARRDDGAVLVRVSSAGRHDKEYPDAIFTFRPGDPQFEYWNRWLIP